MSLTRLLQRFDRWFMGPCPAERLALLRIAVGGFGTLYLLLRYSYWAEPLRYQPESFTPLGVLAFLDAPPGAVLVYGAVTLAIAFGACFTLGYRTAWTGPVYAGLLLLVTTYRNSWGMLFHVEHLLVLHTLGLCLAPVGRAWSLDAKGPAASGDVPGWSVRLLALLTIMTYVIAGVAKLRHTGLEWAAGDVLRQHVAYDALRKIELGGTPSPLGPLLVRQAWLFPPLAWLALALEVGAPLALFGRRVALAWCLLAWSFHFGVLCLMGILFPYPLLFVAYLPFVPAEDWARRVGQRLRRRETPERRLTRRLLPERIRRALLGAHRRLVFRRAMQQFLADPKRAAEPDSSVLKDLVYGWGNEVFSAHEEYLAAALEQTWIAEGPVLECGSGLSSVLVGIVSQARGVPHWVLEHDAVWARRTDRDLRKYARRSMLSCKPLRDYGDFDWYELPSVGLPASFSLVICDGPPGTTRGGRSGLVPGLRGHLKPGSVILLDDVAREAEEKLAQSWQAELPATLAVRGGKKPYALLWIR